MRYYIADCHFFHKALNKYGISNFDITLINSTGNMNGIMVSGVGDLEGFNIGNYTANISAPNSNALNITDSVASKSVINGNFKADVSNGIGIISINLLKSTDILKIM